MHQFVLVYSHALNIFIYILKRSGLKRVNNDNLLEKVVIVVY